jgi:hypothetical protein
MVIGVVARDADAHEIVGIVIAPIVIDVMNVASHPLPTPFARHVSNGEAKAAEEAQLVLCHPSIERLLLEI